MNGINFRIESAVCLITSPLDIHTLYTLNVENTLVWTVGSPYEAQLNHKWSNAWQKCRKKQLFGKSNSLYGNCAGHWTLDRCSKTSEYWAFIPSTCKRIVTCLLPCVPHSCFTATFYYRNKLKCLDSPWAEQCNQTHRDGSSKKHLNQHTIFHSG